MKQTRTPAWAVGMRKLMPGVYVDEKTTEMHLSNYELCEAFDLEYTVENAAAIESLAMDAIRAKFPGIATDSVEHREDSPEAAGL